MQRRLAVGPVVRAAQRLAVDRDDVGAVLGERGDPGDEAGLELLGVKRRDQLAQLVVTGRAVREGAEAAQQVELFLAERGDLHPTLGAGKDRDEVQEQHFVERIEHLACLARVLEALEMLQPFNDLIESSLRMRLRLRHPSILRESRGYG